MFTYTRKKPGTEKLESILVPTEIEANGPKAIDAYVEAEDAGRAEQLAAARSAIAAAEQAAIEKAKAELAAAATPVTPAPKGKRGAAPSSTE